MALVEERRAGVEDGVGHRRRRRRRRRRERDESPLSANLYPHSPSILRVVVRPFNATRTTLTGYRL